MTTRFPLTQLDANGTAPYVSAMTVTPSDTVDLTYVSRGIYVGGAGNLSVIMDTGVTVTFAGIPSGTFLPICCTRVMATSTTATNILAMN